ncbi:MAG: hypothetical protein ACRETN_02135 [Nevskiales bacterium]
MKYDYYDVAVRRITGTGRIIPMSNDESRNSALQISDGESYESKEHRTEQEAINALDQWEADWRKRNTN